MLKLKQHMTNRAAGLARLRAVYDGATWGQRVEGAMFYPLALEAMQDMAEDYPGATVERCAVAVAIVSPQMTWTDSVDQGEDVIDAFYGGFGVASIRCRTFRRNVLLAFHATRYGLPARGPKTSAFSENLQGNFAVSTIDRHMLRAWRGIRESEPRCSLGELRTIQRAIAVIGEEESRAPATVQAIIWTAVRANGS